MSNDKIVWLKDLNKQDVERVGGKNASLGEMIGHLSKLGVMVPEGFATTTHAYREFLAYNDLNKRIETALASLEIENIKALATTGAKIRQWILEASFLPEFNEAVTAAYETLTNKTEVPLSVAVRSSATAEDLSDASFAGQQETFLNVFGIENVLIAIKKVFASLFTDRAIAYRAHQGFSHQLIALSVGIQQMVRSDKATSGVMFTLDTESGFDKVILITSSYGLGELMVQGAVNPDEFYVYKPALSRKKRAIIQKRLGSKQHKMIYAPESFSEDLVMVTPVPKDNQNVFSLTEEEILYLAHQAMIIEEHYGQAMDIEWAKDGLTHKIYIVQARPETVKSRVQSSVLERYSLKSKGTLLVEGRSVGQRIGQGSAVVITDIREMNKVQAGDVLVTDMTDPDWEPVMKRAAAIVTNRGGRTCHAAIIARELGIPAVVGTENATRLIKEGQKVTVSCAEGETGYVYEGLLEFDHKKICLDKMPELTFKIMMTMGNPERAFDFQRLPNSGVGLLRLEFVINQVIGIHPKACLEFETLPLSLQKIIRKRTVGYDSPASFYVEKLTEGIATVAAAFYPKPVVVRLSDFKSNEYANLLGGDHFEPKEENPMLGFRGAARYLSPQFQECFYLECESIKQVREAFGLTNVEVMIPFVRTPLEVKKVIDLLESRGLKRGEQGLRIIMMCEIPANALLAEEFLKYVDGFSIGSNDLTQLTLGLDRDSGLVAHDFDERNEAVKYLLHRAIQACKQANKSVGICGQGPSDHPDFARWLVEEGVDSLSLNPDSMVATWLYLSQKKGDTDVNCSELVIA